MIKIMRAFSVALGERCEFCHADPPGPGKFPDFASDDKENKEKARTMLRMVMAINSDYMTKLGEKRRRPSAARRATTAPRNRLSPWRT